MSGKKRKGLSADEKREKILRIYHESAEPFNLKEIENLGSKAGVVQQTIKEINQSLIDDFLVMSDKIGSANFFWSFPCKIAQDKIRKIENSQVYLTQLTESLSKSENDIKQATQSRSAPGRAEKLARLQQLQSQEKEIDLLLEAKKSCDPAEINRIEKLASENKEHADRWTDNIWAVKKYLTKKKGMSGKEVDKLLHMDSNFDYLEFSEKTRKK